MRFSTAWAKVAAQNVTLKVATAILAGIATVQMVLIGQLSNRDPLVVERTCYSKVVAAKPSAPTPEEIKSFLNESLPMRFDSVVVIKDGFLSLEETATREKEQTALKQRQMLQRILISEIKIDDKAIAVVADRLISIGKIKSALSFNLSVVVQQTNRSESNPYGLVLSHVSQLEEKEKN